MQQTNIGVSYSAHKSLLRTGDLIVFSANKFKGLGGLISFIVRFFTMSEYNHVGVLWITNGRYFLIEAQVPKVKVTPLSDVGSFYYMSMGLEPSEPQMNELLAKVGEEYSKWEAILAYFKKSDMNNKKWICVELARFFYNLFNIDLSDCYTPSDLVTTLLQDYGKKLVYVENK